MKQVSDRPRRVRGPDKLPNRLTDFPIDLEWRRSVPDHAIVDIGGYPLRDDGEVKFLSLETVP
jgi:hypothetical protein